MRVDESFGAGGRSKDINIEGMKEKKVKEKKCKQVNTLFLYRKYIQSVSDEINLCIEQMVMCMFGSFSHK